MIMMIKYIQQHIITVIHISHKNLVFINKNIFYNFDKDTKNLKIIIEFRM